MALRASAWNCARCGELNSSAWNPTYCKRCGEINPREIERINKRKKK